MKKKILVLLLTVAVMATALVGFAACGGDKSGAEFKIGVLHINPKDSQAGYTYAHQTGIQYMIDELGLKESQVIYKDNLDDTDSAAVSAAITGLLAEGCNMIIGTSFGYMEEIQAAAKANPEVIFSHGTGYLDTFGEGQNNNMNNYFGRIYEARYLSGVVAGLKAKELAEAGNAKHNLGYVVAHDNYIAECSSGVNAFALGAQSVYPEVEVNVQALGSWWDPTNETNFAKTLINNYDCGVIAQHCDTENPPKVAKESGCFSIGYNSDMGKAVADAGEERDASTLTSVIWNWGVYYKQAVQAAMKCFTITEEAVSFKDTTAWVELGNYYEDLNEDMYGLAPYSTGVADNTAKYVAAAKDLLMNSTEWDVFSTDKKVAFTVTGDTVTASLVDADLKDNKGNDIAEVTVANITGSMPYYVAGVNFRGSVE